MGEPNAALESSGASPFITKVFAFFMILPFAAAPVLSVHFSKSLAYIMPACGLIGALVLFAGFKRIPDLPKGLMTYAGAVLALAAASILWAFYPDEATERVIKLVVLIVFSLLFIGTARAGRDQIPISGLMDAALIACSFAALLLTADILNDGFFYRLTRGELETPLYSTAVYNKASIVIAVIAACAFLLHPAGATLKRAFFLIPLIGMLYFIQGQAIQVGVAIGLIIYCLFPYKFRWAWLVAYVLIVAGFAAKPIIAPVAYNELAQSFQSVEYMQQAYAAHRLEIWDYISREIWASPFIGHGIEFTRSFDGFDSAKVFLPEVNPIHPHSFILQIWIEFGMLGAVFALIGIGLLMKSIYGIENVRTKRTAFSALAVLMFIASITFNLWQSWWLVFLLMVAALFMMVVKTPDPDIIKGKELPTSA